MEKFYKQYKYRYFFHPAAGYTKICISMFTDSRSGYIGISELTITGKVGESQIDFLAMDKINSIESLV